MAPCKPPRPVKIQVPRHGTKRTSSALNAVIKESANQSKLRFSGHGAKALANVPSKATSAVCTSTTCQSITIGLISDRKMHLNGTHCLFMHELNVDLSSMWGLS